MLSALHFEAVAPTLGTAPSRADVACFIGHVARRVGVPVPEPVKQQWRAAGWLGGPWTIDEQRYDDLLQLPVVLDSWEAFDRLYAWETRTLADGRVQRCASYLGASVRSFFANGGRRAVVVRTGDPWAYLGGNARSTRRVERLSRLLPRFDPTLRPFDPMAPDSWRGIEHLCGLPEVSHLCFPDLSDICAGEPPLPDVERAPPVPPEVFVECSHDEPPDPVDDALRFVQAPQLDVDGFAAWSRAIAGVCAFLDQHRRDVLLIGALPMAQASAVSVGSGVHSGADWLGFLRDVGVLELGAGADAQGTAASAFVQLGWPWLRSSRSRDLPQQLEPADGLLAGVLAANALTRGTFRSVAGTRLPDLSTVEPMPAFGLGPDSPTAQLAQRVCLLGPEPGGFAVLSDVTTSADIAWRQGGSRRLMATLRRAARQLGEEHIFEPNGPALWARLRDGIESLLDAFRAAGALGGNSAEEAYRVRCDRSTMSQNDLDNGRVRIEVSVLPAFAVERITFALDLAAGGSAASRLDEVA
ncbi:phage tail sheath family protein [Montanilutibacter psychrotolerans]|uniref:Phage tail sheath family protein n=1 Tax=Montanilutibacter psychrotolerans TaxID=1327343 RepID=A0A3M8SXU2_9GAMM|nr:phage tail sheath family protein [Lysobacter psychrotolerans]RNF86191.1 phage tail sheath family protein [Lysobacter psychrotolerans]